jgi:2-keto-4-pentenoate hydratase/2-oxohepta-3-ene-1,7-dioic acid hydratase in catechol pathway
MKICRFDDNRVGLVEGDEVHDITSHAGDALVPARPADLKKFPKKKLSTVKLLSPVRAPGKIIAAPVNYKAHIEEMKKANISPGFNIWDIEKAGLFLKATSSLVGPSQGIEQRFLDRRTDHEVELVFVMGKTASKVSREKALSYVAGYCRRPRRHVCAAARIAASANRWTATPCSAPGLTTADEIRDPQNLQITLRQNGEVRQDTSTSDMLWGRGAPDRVRHHVLTPCTRATCSSPARRRA